MAPDPVALDLADKARVECAALPSCRAASEFSTRTLVVPTRTGHFANCVFLSERISDDGEIHLAMIVQRHNEEAVS
jgi:hypothetical protein